MFPTMLLILTRPRLYPSSISIILLHLPPGKTSPRISSVGIFTHFLTSITRILICYSTSLSPNLRPNNVQRREASRGSARKMFQLPLHLLVSNGLSLYVIWFRTGPCALGSTRNRLRYLNMRRSLNLGISRWVEFWGQYITIIGRTLLIWNGSSWARERRLKLRGRMLQGVSLQDQKTWARGVAV